MQKKNAVRIQNERLGLRTSGIRETRVKLKELGRKPLNSVSAANRGSLLSSSPLSPNVLRTIHVFLCESN